MLKVWCRTDSREDQNPKFSSVASLASLFRVVYIA